VLERLLDQVGKGQWVQRQAREARDVVIRDCLSVQPADSALCEWLPSPSDWRATCSDDPRLDNERALYLRRHRRRREGTNCQEDESSERPTSFNELLRTSSLAQTTSSNINININIRPYPTAAQSAQMID
jgi:hypothetical protein